MVDDYSSNLLREKRNFIQIILAKSKSCHYSFFMGVNVIDSCSSCQLLQNGALTACSTF